MTQTGAVPAERKQPPRFVELEPSAGIAVAECVIELEGSRGKMRIHWKGRCRRTEFVEHHFA